MIHLLHADRYVLKMFQIFLIFPLLSFPITVTEYCQAAGERIPYFLLLHDYKHLFSNVSIKYSLMFFYQNLNRVWTFIFPFFFTFPGIHQKRQFVFNDADFSGLEALDPEVLIP